MWAFLAWAAVFGLFFLALKETPVTQIIQVLSRLNAGQIALLVGVTLVFLLLVNARWAILLRSLGWRVPLAKLILYRLVSFSVSYSTPGPQFGGEPVQVHLLHRQNGVPLTTAISSVLLDRLVDLLANFTFLFIGSLVVLMGGLFVGWQASVMWVLSLILFLLPTLHLLALGQNRRPLGWLVGRVKSRRPIIVRVQQLICQTEEQVSCMVRTKPGVLAGMIGLSVLAWGAAILEFWLSLRFLGVSAGGVETISALTAARLAFLLPLPGGLGALEASQSLAAQLLGWGPAVGLALSLVIRARDVILALIGFGVGGFVYRAFLFRGLKEKMNPGSVFSPDH